MSNCWPGCLVSAGPLWWDSRKTSISLLSLQLVSRKSTTSRKPRSYLMIESDQNPLFLIKQFVHMWKTIPLLKWNEFLIKLEQTLKLLQLPCETFGELLCKLDVRERGTKNAHGVKEVTLSLFRRKRQRELLLWNCLFTIYCFVSRLHWNID